MKATFDLPPDLIKRLKLRARRRKKAEGFGDRRSADGLKVKPKKMAQLKPVIVKSKKTGLPVIAGNRPSPPGPELTNERIAEILIEQEVEWMRDAG